MAIYTTWDPERKLNKNNLLFLVSPFQKFLLSGLTALKEHCGIDIISSRNMAKLLARYKGKSIVTFVNIYPFKLLENVVDLSNNHTPHMVFSYKRLFAPLTKDVIPKFSGRDALLTLEERVEMVTRFFSSLGCDLEEIVQRHAIAKIRTRSEYSSVPLQDILFVLGMYSTPENELREFPLIVEKEGNICLLNYIPNNTSRWYSKQCTTLSNKTLYYHGADILKCLKESSVYLPASFAKEDINYHCLPKDVFFYYFRHFLKNLTTVIKLDKDKELLITKVDGPNLLRSLSKRLTVILQRPILLESTTYDRRSKYALLHLYLPEKKDDTMIKQYYAFLSAAHLAYITLKSVSRELKNQGIRYQLAPSSVVADDMKVIFSSRLLSNKNYFDSIKNVLLTLTANYLLNESPMEMLFVKGEDVFLEKYDDINRKPIVLHYPSASKMIKKKAEELRDTVSLVVDTQQIPSGKLYTILPLRQQFKEILKKTLLA